MQQTNTVDTTNWQRWHEEYERPGSSLARRLTIVCQRISETLDRCPPGSIQVLSLCAGDGRDLFGVLQSHPRAADVRGRLIEKDETLAQQASDAAPPGIQVVCGDAGQSANYKGAVPADLLLCCGVFGNISEDDIQTTIRHWPMLCADGATVLWTRGAFSTGPDLRETVRHWVRSAGFEEIAFDGAPEKYGVGVAKMARSPEPLRLGMRLFQFRSRPQWASGDGECVCD